MIVNVGKLMKDGSALSTYDIQDGHTVHLVAKPVPSVVSASANSAASNVPAAASSSNSNDDAASGRSTGPRFTFANRDDDDDFVGSAVRRNREHLRRLMSNEDTLNREDAESEASRRRNLREPSVLRPQTTTRRRIPGPGEPTGAAWNMGVLREALGGQSGSSGTADESATRLHGLRELFGDDVLEEASPSSVASEMGLGPSVLNANGSSANEPRTNLDHIVQGMMTLRTVLSTVAVQPEVEQRNESVRSEIDEEEDVEDTEINLPNQPITSPSTEAGGARSRLRRGRRRFFVGQWLDVKDTVNQWLECTVMDISEDKVLIHYHGWPSRWDEWIDFNSNRIAAFRTRTVHTVNSQHMSPMPLTRLPNAPSIGNPDVREMVSRVRDLMREIMPHVDRFADLCDEQTRSREQRQQGVQSFGEFDSARDDAFLSATSAQSRSEDISEMAHLIAPLFDRFGRLLTDSARCLEPLLRPELRSYNQQRQVQQARASAARNRTTRQEASAPIALESEDFSLSIRDLISTTMVNPNDSQGGRRNIDVHIHAIVAPSSLTSLASLARAASNASIVQATNATANHRVRAPLSPPVSSGFEEAFGLPDLREPLGSSDGRALLNDEANDDLDNDRESVDHSRTPLLGSFRRQERHTSSSISEARRRRTVDQNLENFLTDDFFGTSFDHDERNDDAAAPANSRSPAASMRGNRFDYQPIPSPISSFDEAQRDGLSGSDNSLGVIPEIAEANERAREQEERIATTTQVRDTQGNSLDEERTRGDSSASSSSASSSSSNGTSYPSFLEFMRRSLSRNFGFSSASERRQSDNSEDDIPTLEPLRSSISSSSSSSSSSSFPVSHTGAVSDAHFRNRRLSSSNSIEEEMDQVD